MSWSKFLDLQKKKKKTMDVSNLIICQLNGSLIDLIALSINKCE